MSDPFLGEIRMFAGAYAPRFWAFCNGQVLAISDNNALYSLLGTAYGGDGRTTFGLPDMRSRLPVCYGQGQGLSPYVMGQKSGVEQVILNSTQIHSHSHSLSACSSAADTAAPIGALPADISAVPISLYGETADVTLNESSIGEDGGNAPHSNLMPSLCISFIICLEGTYPSRN
jgi:microcystin-dependent protein